MYRSRRLPILLSRYFMYSILIQGVTVDMRQVRALLKDSQYDAAIAEARTARDAHKDDRSVREVTTPSKHKQCSELSAAAWCRPTRCKPYCVVMPHGASLTIKPKDVPALGCAGPT